MACGCGAIDDRILLASPRYEGEDHCIRFLSHQGKFVSVNKEQYKLGQHFLTDHIYATRALKQSYNKGAVNFKRQLLAIVPEEKKDRNRACMLFLKRNPLRFKAAIEKFQPPLRYRWSCWLVLSFKDHRLDDDNYQRLIRSYRHEVEEIVRKDVPRTFSHNPFFSSPIDGVEVGREILYNICKAVGTYFEEVGYVQGLNFLVGFFLQISACNQMEVLNLVVSIMTNSRFLFLGLYDVAFPVVNFLKFAFHKSLYKADRKVYQSISDSMLPDDIWLTKWFISLFTGYFPVLHAARAIDFILANDISAIVSYTLGLVISMRKYIIGKDMEQLNNLFNSLQKSENLPDTETILKIAIKNKIPSKRMLSLLDQFRSDESVYGREQFERYVPHFKDYFITGKSKDVNFKFYDFDLESVRSLLKSYASNKSYTIIEVHPGDKDMPDEPSAQRVRQFK